MSAQVDEASVHNFLGLIHFYAGQAIGNGIEPGLMQLIRIHPDDESISVSRYAIGDVAPMATDAIASANAGHNVYIEGRTVRKELRGNKRGGLKDTMWVFGLVADCDADMDKAGNVTVNPTIMSETSPGNRHCWFLLAHAAVSGPCQGGRRCHAGEIRCRRRHRRRHAALSRRRYPEFSVEGQTCTRPHDNRADEADPWHHRQAVGAGRAACRA